MVTSTNNKKTNWINTKDKLPKENIYVLGKYNGDNWFDADDQEHVNIVVVKLIKGLSLQTRQDMIELKILDPKERRLIYHSEDEYGNNLVSYKWHSFGPDNYNGQEIQEWTPIPE